jgi:serine/threonine protein kinase
VLWHHAVHRAQGERLYFWRLTFAPTYQRDTVRQTLLEVFSQFDVKSAVCYELFGPYDLLIRAWLPGEHDLANFQDVLIGRLTEADLIMCDPFVVYRPVRHWLFPPENGKMPDPDPANYSQLGEEIEAIETTEVGEDRLKQLATQHVIGDFKRSSEKTDEDDPGIKFAVAVGGDARLTTAQSGQFEQTLIGILDSARTISQRSLYAGAGFGHFLILGRVNKAAFYELAGTLLDEINQAHIHSDYGARTYTHVSGQKQFLIFQESLVKPLTPAVPDSSPSNDEIAGEGRRVRLPSLRRSQATSENPMEEFEDRFEFRQKLGEGGFASVYEVYDKLERVDRALKIFQTPGASERVRRELSSLRKIEHPNVVRVYWADRTSDGRYYIVSEFVPGETMDAFTARDKRLSLDEAVAAVTQLLEALVAIHPNDRRMEELRSGDMSEDEFAELQELQDAGIVHRDIKPANLILTPEGRIKLLDFNIASVAGDPMVTRSGTPPYQAPDNPPTWDVSTDLFATGVVLYQLVTGEHPYKKEEPRLDQEPIDPRKFREALPLPMAQFLSKAAAPRREERFATAGEMKSALLAAKRQSDLETRSDSLGERLRVFRESADLSLRELSEMSGVSAAMISQIERGETSPTINIAKKVATGLGVTLANLLGEDALEPRVALVSELH